MVSLGFAETNQEPISTQTLAAETHFDMSLHDIIVSRTKKILNDFFVKYIVAMTSPL